MNINSQQPRPFIDVSKIINKPEVYCKLSKNVMINPAMLACGHNFEERAIKEWFETNKNRLCPTCNNPSIGIFQNTFLKNVITNMKREGIVGETTNVRPLSNSQGHNNSQCLLADYGIIVNSDLHNKLHKALKLWFEDDTSNDLAVSQLYELAEQNENHGKGIERLINDLINGKIKEPENSASVIYDDSFARTNGGGMPNQINNNNTNNNSRPNNNNFGPNNTNNSGFGSNSNNNNTFEQNINNNINNPGLNNNNNNNNLNFAQNNRPMGSMIGAGVTISPSFTRLSIPPMQGQLYPVPSPAVQLMQQQQHQQILMMQQQQFRHLQQINQDNINTNNQSEPLNNELQENNSNASHNTDFREIDINPTPSKKTKKTTTAQRRLSNNFNNAETTQDKFNVIKEFPKIDQFKDLISKEIALCKDDKGNSLLHLSKKITKRAGTYIETILNTNPGEELINHKNNKGNTALHCTIERANWVASKALLKAKAKTDIPNNEGVTVWSMKKEIGKHFGSLLKDTSVADLDNEGASSSDDEDSNSNINVEQKR